MFRALGIAALIVLTAACGTSAGQPSPATATADPLAGTYSGFGSATAVDQMKAVTAAFTKVHPTVQFKLTVVDTETSIVKVRNADQDADFGFIGRELLPTDGVVALTPIGATGSAFAVNASNTVHTLSKTQLKAILTGATSDWSMVGGSIMPIRVIVREPTSQTRTGLEAYVFGKDKPVYVAGAITTTSANTASNEMLDALKSFSGSIGMVTLNSAALANKSITLVTMDGIAPTLANLASGTWPVRRAIHLTTNTDATKVPPAIEALIAWTKTAEGQAVIAGQ
ncbi:MAG TPA: substrate-binding domain-containing protein [Candidatus Limnocylindria bacterium]